MIYIYSNKLSRITVYILLFAHLLFVYSFILFNFTMYDFGVNVKVVPSLRNESNFIILNNV